MSRKLDNNSRDAWEQARIIEIKNKEIPFFKVFLDFVLEWCKSLEAKLDKIKPVESKSNFRNKNRKSEYRKKKI